MADSSGKRFTHAIEYYALRAFAGFLCILPLRLALGLGSLIGRIGWLTHMRRDLVLANLRQALPHISDAERLQIAASAARSFGRTSAEFIRFGIKDRDAIVKVVNIEGLDTLKTALEANKGAIVLTGHLGSWAMYFAAVSNNGIPIALLVGKQHNEKVDAFVHRIPGDKIEFISKGRAAVKKIIAMLQANRAVVIVSDQHAGRGGILSPFLGRPALTLSLAGAFAVKHGAPVFFMHGHRLPEGNHILKIQPLDEPPTESDEERKLAITHRYNELMGEAVKAHPDQYFWYHRRWRDHDIKS